MTLTTLKPTLTNPPSSEQKINYPSINPTRLNIQKIALVALGIIASGTTLSCIFLAASFSITVSLAAGSIAITLPTALLAYLVRQNIKRIQLTAQIEKLEFPHRILPPSTPVEGNRVHVTKNSAETTQIRLDLIDQAEQSIELCGNFVGGKVFREALDHIAIQMRAKPTLKVHLIGHNALLENEDRNKIKQLQKAFGEKFQFLEVGERVEFSNKLLLLQLHWKLFVVDEKYFIIGGTGLQDQLCTDGRTPANEPHKENTYEKLIFGGCRDLDIIGEGPEFSRQLRMRFYQQYALWETLNNPIKSGESNPHRYFDLSETKPKANALLFQNNPEIIKDVPIRMTLSGPDEDINSASREYINLIDSTKPGDEITIGNLVFNPESSVYSSLMKATARKVHLKVITNGVHKNSPLANTLWVWAQRAKYHHLHLESPTTEIYEYAVRNILYHAKAIAAGKRCAIGSYNLGNRSLKDYELIITLDHEQVTEKIRQVIKEAMKPEYSTKVSIDEHHRYHYGWVDSLKGAVSRHLLAPFLG